jgi:hypothetical protein
VILLLFFPGGFDEDWMGLSGNGIGSDWHGKGTLDRTLATLQSQIMLCCQFRCVESKSAQYHMSMEMQSLSNLVATLT